MTTTLTFVSIIIVVVHLCKLNAKAANPNEVKTDWKNLKNDKIK
jgi:hypothetical protein